MIKIKVEKIREYLNQDIEFNENNQLYKIMIDKLRVQFKHINGETIAL